MKEVTVGKGETITGECPYCNARYEASRDDIGKVVNCNKCGSDHFVSEHTNDHKMAKQAPVPNAPPIVSATNDAESKMPSRPVSNTMKPRPVINSTSPARGSIIKQAGIIQMSGGEGGKETRLESCESLFSILGLVVIAVAAVSVVISLIVGTPLLWLFILISGIVLYVQLQIMVIVFGAGAEVVRLLKRLNKLPYEGKISAPSKAVWYECSFCNQRVGYNDISCSQCGSALDNK